MGKTLTQRRVAPRTRKILAFRMATAAPYKVSWVIGSAPKARRGTEADDLRLLGHAKNMPYALMNAASSGWDMACRTVGECRHGGVIDREIVAMVIAPGGETNRTGPKQFAYARYDPDVTREGLDKLGLKNIAPAHVQVMDSVTYIPEIQEVGTAYAASRCDVDPFEEFV